NDLERRLGSVGNTGLESALLAAPEEVPAAFQRAYEVTQRDDYAEGDWLVYPLGNSLKTISPYISSDAYASTIQSHVLETLLTRNPETLEWQGLLAESWQVSDDGLSIRFKLRRGV